MGGSAALVVTVVVVESLSVVLDPASLVELLVALELKPPAGTVVVELPGGVLCVVLAVDVEVVVDAVVASVVVLVVV